MVRGAESNNRMSVEQLRSMSDDEIRDYQGLAIRTIAESVLLNDIELRDFPVRVTMQTRGNILLGMDVIKEWDSHIGRNSEGKTVFMACPFNAEDEIKQAYYGELERRFSLKKVG